jgi:hypothetical protein
MRPPDAKRRPGGGGAADHLAETTVAEDNRPNAKTQVQFPKHRFARAILKGDAEHAKICRRLLDRLLNGEAAR